MALHNRELCKVGESPSKTRRAESPRAMTSGDNESLGECLPSTSGKNDPESPKSPKLSPRHSPSPSSSSPSTPEPKGDRRISARLLMQKGDRVESVINKASKSPKHAAWKSSKFFSRSMASGELLKGFKKLSATPSASAGNVPEESGQSSDSGKNSDIKSFKNRFSSLRRKSGSDTDKIPVVDEETLKHGSSDIKGIVCKKEDIISLMHEVNKERRISSPGELNIPSSLPTTAVPVLKSPSLKIPPGSPIGRSAFRTSRSSSLDPTMVPNERLNLRPQFKVPIRTVVHPPPVCHRISDDLCIKKKSFLDVIPDTKRRLSGPLIEIKENKILETNGSNEASGGSEEPSVQWDESNFVDPNLLGGAIEAFLKGMGSTSGNGGTSGGATGGATGGAGTSGTSEKKVCFKKP